LRFPAGSYEIETTALDGGEFFARVAFRIIHKALTPREAIEQVAQTSSAFIKTKVQQAINKFEEATDPARPLSKEEFVDDLALTSMARLWDVGKSEPIKVGKASPTEGVLPGSIYLILKYGDFAAAAKANAEIGGDSASRAVAVGMVLGAWKGVEGIPQKLADNLVGWARFEKLMNSLPSKTSKIKGAFFGAVVADALALGTHYEYDAKRIKGFYGGIDRSGSSRSGKFGAIFEAGVFVVSCHCSEVTQCVASFQIFLAILSFRPF